MNVLAGESAEEWPEAKGVRLRDWSKANVWRLLGREDVSVQVVQPSEWLAGDCLLNLAVLTRKTSPPVTCEKSAIRAISYHTVTIQPARFQSDCYWEATGNVTPFANRYAVTRSSKKLWRNTTSFSCLGVGKLSLNTLF